MGKLDRLWVQVTAQDRTALEMAGAEVIAGVIASGIGAVVKGVADRLIATDQYTITTTLAFEPAFRRVANSSRDEFLPKFITLNVGPEPINPKTFLHDTPKLTYPPHDMPKLNSPVVIQVEIVESKDRTAVAAKVRHWTYQRSLEPGKVPFRARRRKVTVEIKMTDIDGRALLTLAMQVQGTQQQINSQLPQLEERLPWAKRPSMSVPPETPTGQDVSFGPVNIECKITEVAETSGFAKFLGATLNSQKGAIETYVKERVTQALDDTAAANAQLQALTAASAARQRYEAAYKEVEAAKQAAAQASRGSTAALDLQVKLAILRQREVLAREAFQQAMLAFDPLPPIQ
jgi:hypothetical protein